MKNLINLCALSFFIMFGYNAYLNFTSIKFFITFTQTDIVLICTFFIWIFIRSKRPRYKKISFGSDFLILGIITLMIIIQALRVAIEQGDFILSFFTVLQNSAKYYLFFIIGYLLFLDIFRRFTHVEIREFLKTIAKPTVVLSMLYILFINGVPVYAHQQHIVLDFCQKTIYRDNISFPVFVFFALSFYFSDTKRNLSWLLAIIILLLSIILTFTRGIILSLLSQIGIVLLFLLIIKKYKIHTKIVTLNNVLIGCFIFLILFNFIFPISKEFLISRFGFLQSGFDSNIYVRQQMLTSSIEQLRAIPGALYFGLGRYPDNFYVPNPVGVGDLLIIDIIVKYGLFGVCLYTLLILFNIYTALSKVKEVGSLRLSILLFSVQLSAVMFVTLLQGDWPKTIQWAIPIALISIEKRNLWVEHPKTLPGFPFIAGIKFDWINQNKIIKTFLIILFLLLMFYIGYYLTKIIPQ